MKAKLINFADVGPLVIAQELVCQGSSLTRKPTPVKNWIEEIWYPDEDGEIIELTQGFSLARKYSSKQLREIDRRSTKQRKFASQIILINLGEGMKAN
jgi:hypothetical protein